MDLIVRCLLFLHVFIIEARSSNATDANPVQFIGDGNCISLQPLLESKYGKTGNSKFLHLEFINITEPSKEMFDCLAEGLDSLCLFHCNVDFVYLSPTLIKFELSGAFESTSTTQLIIDSNATYKLEELELLYLSQLPANIEKLRALKVFKCSYVESGVIDFAMFSEMMQLESIVMQNITGVTISASLQLPSLRTLYITDSLVTFLNNASCDFPKLESVNLSNNSLQEVPIYFNNLTAFTVMQNKLQRVNLDQFTNMNQLSYLVLSENEISEVTTQNMVNLPGLKSFILSNNSLTELNVTLWNMPALEVLHISYNKLKQVAGLPTLFTGKRFLVETAGNPWDMEWFEKTAKQVKARRI